MNDEKDELKLPIWLAGAWVNVNRHPPICFLFQLEHTRMFIFGPERMFSYSYFFGCDFTINANTSDDEHFTLDAVSNVADKDALKISLKRGAHSDKAEHTGTFWNSQGGSHYDIKLNDIDNLYD